MLFKAPVGTPDGIADAKFEGDKLKVLHIQNVEEVMAQAHQARKDPRQGWSEDRNMRRIASIPAIEWARHPEWDAELMAMGKSPSLMKWLKGEYGSLFKTVEKI